MRTSAEVKTAFEAKGCTVMVRDLGHSYRAGGEIIILAPGVEFASGVKFAKADFAAMDGTGYDGRGRHYAVWIATAGEFVPCTEAEFANCGEDRRVALGSEHKSCSNTMWFCHRDDLASKGMADFASAFAALGL